MPVIKNWFAFTNGAQGVPPSDAPLKNALKRIYQGSLEESKGDHIEAREWLPAHIENDRRFDDFDAHQLAARFEHCYDTGITLDLAAPELKRGGKAQESRLITNSVPVAPVNVTEYKIQRRK